MRYLPVLAAAGLVVSGLLVQQPAQAAPDQVTATCSFPVPPKLVLSGGYQEVEFPAGPGCPKTMVSSTWDAVPDVGRAKYGTGCARLGCSVTVNLTPLGGTTHWTPVGYGMDINGRKVADLLPATSVTKAASVARLAGTRQGTKVTLTASATYYSPSRNSYLRAHGRILLQYNDAGRWKSLVYVTPASSGTATYTITTNRSRSYRVYVPSTQSVWYTYSPAVTR
ncbi:hypothetical protein [Kribbella sp. NPDC004875]|uniref:hypothetical protein n=1 Tax=Kribbella sp. NPDC004875 TaxID=3364107 RepID=UPI0036A71EA9